VVMDINEVYLGTKGQFISEGKIEGNWIDHIEHDDEVVLLINGRGDWAMWPQHKLIKLLELVMVD